MEDVHEKPGSLGTLAGVVQKGRGQGKQLGFPTANLTVDTSSIPVPEGVYACYVKVEGQRYRAAVSVGVSPLFEGSTTSNIEVHLIDFNEDIYDKTIEIEFVKCLRPMMKFSSIDELVDTVKQNIEETKCILSL